ncbi:MAG: ATP-dependent zinc metalloprotease FtsH [Bacteroidales bacterium]|nr:ATP-dependent zinc metalloprotease FtsH [Bacteroidales bacterium]
MDNNQDNNLFGNKPGGGAPKGMGKKPKFNIFWVYGAILVGVLLMQYFFSTPEAKTTTWQEFKNGMLANHDVEKVVVIRNEGIVEVFLKPESLKKYDSTGGGLSGLSGVGPHYSFTIGSIDKFEENLMLAQENSSEESKIYPQYDDHIDYFGQFFSFMWPLLLLVVIWIFIFRKMGKGAGGAGGNIFSVGKSKAKLFDKDTNVKVDFTNVAGLEEAKVEIMEIVDFLKNPKKYTDLGGKIPKGALLVGPPGTGKTLLAKAVAGEANVPFFSMSGSDFVEMFVGVGASRVRDLFKQAKEKSPCIVFIDEIDAIGRARGKNPAQGANDERENTLNQLLTEMDGFGTNSGVIILAATNRADILDKALMRAGRFDRQIHVELPDINERKQIFEVHMKPLKLGNDINSDFLSKQTPGFSGADIANVCNEAALIAARKGHENVTKQDFLDAVDRIIGGLERKNKIITKSEKETIAFHEAGHASVSWLLEHAHPLVKVTIIPRGKALGAAWYLPEERQITTTEQLLDEMCATLGGRAAEEIMFSKVSTGALNDLERVTKQAFSMISYYGMNKKVGNLSYYDSTGANEFGFGKPYSEHTAELIDKEVKEMIELQYTRAKQLLTDNIEGLKKLAGKLLEKEVIFSDDLVDVFGDRPWGQPLSLNAKDDKAIEPSVDKTEDVANNNDTKQE